MFSCKPEIQEPPACTHPEGFEDSGNLVQSARLIVDSSGKTIFQIDTVGENYKCKICEKEFPKTKLAFSTDNNATTIGISKEVFCSYRTGDILLYPNEN